MSSAHPPPSGGRDPGFAPPPGRGPADGTVPGGPPFAGPQQGGLPHTDPRFTEPQHGGPQHGGPQYGDPQHGGPQYGDPQQGGPQYGDPQQGGPRYGDPQYGGPPVTGPRHEAPQQAPAPVVDRGGSSAAPAGGGDPGAGHRDMGGDTGGDVGRDVGDVSLGELIGDVTRDLSTLMRQELELARAEIKQEVTKTAKGAGALGGAGLAGYFVLLFLSIALWSALSNLMDAGWAGLVVALLWGVVGAVLFVVGRGQLRAVNPKPERTVDTLSQVPEALRPHSGTPHRGGHQ